MRETAKLPVCCSAAAIAVDGGHDYVGVALKGDICELPHSGWGED
jgi:hypothetical protein